MRAPSRAGTGVPRVSAAGMVVGACCAAVGGRPAGRPAARAAPARAVRRSRPARGGCVYNDLKMDDGKRREGGREGGR